ncbi:metallophosphoesterase [Actinoplanes sp. CA-252034]|uniref:metallophosphoesterase n=1 Tax=Actinoplanes sp. CA-252034 TaxID=3239906 RepID=UPI003D99E18F
MLLFFAVVLLGIGLIHYYLWKRLVRDPLPPGLGRRVGTVVAVLLCVLAPVTMIGVRAGYFMWLSWPGYLWIAVMFYLLVVLAVLEIPRLLLMRLWAGSGRTAQKTVDVPAPIRPAEETQPAASRSQAATRPGGAAITQPASTTQAGAASPQATATVEAPGPPAETRPGADSRAAATAGNGRDPAGAGGAAGAGGPAGAGGAASKGGPADASGAASKGAPADAGGPASEAGTPESGVSTPAGDGPAGDAEERRGIERRLLLARGTAIFAGLTAAGITGYGVKTATGAPQIDRVQLPMAKLPRAMDGTRLAVVSDIHIGPLTGVNHAQRIVQVINSVNADLVCVVGDLVDGSVAELGRFAAPLAGIESRHGAFFVTGNHEYYSGAEEWVEEVARLGIRPLRNERVAINGLDLAGVNDLSGEEQGDAPDFARALGDRDTARPVVLMAHQPVAAVEAAPFGVDLQVSGHTHGGQMAPFNLLVKLQQPVVSGFGEVDGVPVYVTNGAGFWGPPVRVGAPPQVTVIELRTA